MLAAAPQAPMFQHALAGRCLPFIPRGGQLAGESICRANRGGNISLFPSRPRTTEERRYGAVCCRGAAGVAFNEVMLARRVDFTYLTFTDGMTWVLQGAVV
ncbi:hypothetical protein [Arthrobacter sp. UYEF3]|uniref:hypothetical protein n=1 Tax=Arthrobacter sp. UYEF3 TaxID=1756365 RepID=UPI003395EC7B